MHIFQLVEKGLTENTIRRFEYTVLNGLRVIQLRKRMKKKESDW